MNKELAAVTRFARQHHRKQWSVTQFVASVQARLCFAPIEGGRIPGISCRSGTTVVIGIDEAILGTGLYVPILAHELSHLILESTGIWLCAPFGSTSRVAESWTSPIERNAWFGAALLSISRRHITRFKQGSALPEDIATQCMCPAEFFNFAYAVHAAMDNEMPVNLHAANLAYDRWMIYMTAALRGR
jgi:hypothetical protein